MTIGNNYAGCVNQYMVIHWTANQILRTPLCILYFLMP